MIGIVRLLRLHFEEPASRSRVSPESVAPHVRCYPCARHKAPNKRPLSPSAGVSGLSPFSSSGRSDAPDCPGANGSPPSPPQAASGQSRATDNKAESTITFSSVIHFTFNIIQSFHLRGDTPIEDQGYGRRPLARDSNHISAASVKSPPPKVLPYSPPNAPVAWEWRRLRAANAIAARPAPSTGPYLPTDSYQRFVRKQSVPRPKVSTPPSVSRPARPRSAGGSGMLLRADRQSKRLLSYSAAGGRNPMPFSETFCDPCATVYLL